MKNKKKCIPSRPTSRISYACVFAVTLALGVVGADATLVTLDIDDANAVRLRDIDADGEGEGVFFHTLNLGANTVSHQFQPLFVFEMSGMPDGNGITNAHFSVDLTIDRTISFAADLYAIRTSSSPDALASDYHSPATLIMADFPSAGSLGSKSTDAAGDAALGAYLTTNWSDGDYVFLSLRSDPLTVPDGEFIAFGSSLNGWTEDSTTARLSTSFNAIPEPSSLTLLGIGSLLFCRRLRLRRSCM